MKAQSAFRSTRLPGGNVTCFSVLLPTSSLLQNGSQNSKINGEFEAQVGAQSYKS